MPFVLFVLKGVPGIDGVSVESIMEGGSNVGEMEKGVSIAVKNIGKPCTVEPYARFDEGALRMKGLSEHVVATCGKASVKEPEETCRISALLYSELCPTTRDEMGLLLPNG